MSTDIYKEVFNEINHEWAVLSAGTLSDFGCMTIAWASIGALWVKPVVTLYVKPMRNTHDYLMQNDYFALSVFSQDYKKDLITIGSISGRDDPQKVEKTSLTPIAIADVVSFSQAQKVVVCKKLYQQKMDIAGVPSDIKTKYYEHEEIHTMFIGEIKDIVYLQ